DTAGAGDAAGAFPQAVLIRPDGYVAWTAPGTDRDLTDVLGHWFGTPQRTGA
ncbi:hypothetical protein ACFWFC_21445, partial [Streptomyces venezuelae]